MRAKSILPVFSGNLLSSLLPAGPGTGERGDFLLTFLLLNFLRADLNMRGYLMDVRAWFWGVMDDETIFIFGLVVS